MKKLDWYMIGTIIYFVSFVIANEIIFIVKGSIPDTLVTMGLGGGVAELMFGMLIKRSNNKEEKHEHPDNDVDHSNRDDIQWILDGSGEEELSGCAGESAGID